MSKKFKPEVAAALLLEAVFTTDEKACAKFGVTRQTLYNYRKRLAEDDELLLIFTTKKRELDKAWADDLPAALKKSLALLSECFEGFGKDEVIYRRNPELIAAIAGAAKICAEVYYTGKVIDARLAEQNRPEGQVLTEEPAPAESQYAN